MPDSTYIIDKQDSVSLDSLIVVAQYNAQITAYNKEKEDYEDPATIAFGVFIILFLVVSLSRILRSKEKGHYIIGGRTNYHEDDTNAIYVPAEPTPKPDKNYLVYNGNKIGVSKQDSILILQKYYPYYNNLNPIQRGKFIDRLYEFIKEKTFVIYAKEGFKEMPILLSAAAIQLTFGLENFMLPNYKYIQIHPEEYFAVNSIRVLAGHVQGNSITIAWNQFLKGYKNPMDGVNVGLHEMAHAVYYQHVIVDKKREKDFYNCFNEVMEEGAEVYELKTKQHVLFTNNAFKDLQEFWAESVELFFEKPFDLKNNYSELFEAIKDLLNQDPCNSSNPVVSL